MTVELLIGGYTDPLPHANGHSPGIVTVGIDDVTLIPPVIAARVKNPSWMTATHSGDAVYAVEENDMESPGALVALRRDPRTGHLNVISQVSSGGTAPAHLALSPAEDRLVTANYGSGTVTVHEIRPDRSIGDMLDLVQHSGNGPHRERQEAAHPHQIVFDPGTNRFLVPDLGLDSVLTYELGADGLTELTSERLTLPPGTGPRHLAFHPDGRHLLVLGELSATIDLFTRSDPSAPFAPSQRISILEDQTDDRAGAEVLINREGNLVFAGNRGQNPMITVLQFDHSHALLTIAAHAAAPAGPRAMTLVDDDRLLLVAGQDSNELVAYAYDPRTSALDRVASVSAASPACIFEVRTRLPNDRGQREQ